MIATARVMAPQVNTGASVADCATDRPAKMLAITSRNPIPEHSSTLPGLQYRSDERPRPGNRGEMVPEHDPLIGRLEIVSVAHALGGRSALVVEGHHARGDEFGVEAVAGHIGACGGQNQPDAVDMLPAGE